MSTTPAQRQQMSGGLSPLAATGLLRWLDRLKAVALCGTIAGSVFAFGGNVWWYPSFLGISVGMLALLEAPGLRGMWTAWYNTPLLPYTNFNNTVVLGSVVGWLLLTVPIFFAARYGVARYRATIGERVRQSRLYKAITASQVYNWYRLFRPS